MTVEHTRITLTRACLRLIGMHFTMDPSKLSVLTSVEYVTDIFDSLERLQEIKTALDPHNVFRWPQSM